MLYTRREILRAGNFQIDTLFFEYLLTNIKAVTINTTTRNYKNWNAFLLSFWIVHLIHSRSRLLVCIHPKSHLKSSWIALKSMEVQVNYFQNCLPISGRHWHLNTHLVSTWNSKDMWLSARQCLWIVLQVPDVIVIGIGNCRLTVSFKANQQWSWNKRFEVEALYVPHEIHKFR